MNRFWSSSLLAVVLLSNASTSTAQLVDGSTTDAGRLSAAQVVEAVQRFYDRTSDFQADFVQVERNRLSGAEQRRRGTLRTRKPGRMRWDYADPAGNLALADGTSFWLYDATQQHAMQSSLAASQLPTALSFLLGNGRIAESFTAELLNENEFRYPTGYVLSLRPRRPHVSMDRVLFFVDRGSYQLTSVVVIDVESNQNRFFFSNPRVNTNVPLSTFQWSPPRGVSVSRP